MQASIPCQTVWPRDALSISARSAIRRDYAWLSPNGSAQEKQQERDAYFRPQHFNLAIGNGFEVDAIPGA